MKLTEDKLRSIIREEAEKLDENRNSADALSKNIVEMIDSAGSKSAADTIARSVEEAFGRRGSKKLLQKIYNNLGFVGDVDNI